MTAVEMDSQSNPSRRRSGSRELLPGDALRPRKRPFNKLPYVMLLPALVVFGGVLGYPLVQVVLLSFQKYGTKQIIARKSGQWTGVANYSKIFGDHFFYLSLMRTVFFTAICVAATLVIGLLVALMLKRIAAWMRGLVMVALIMAWVMPALTSTIVWNWMFETQYGIVNWLLSHIGLTSFDQKDWFGRSAILAFTVIIVMIVWQAVPFVALSLYAGLSQIPGEIYEAASVDGASFTTAFRKITLPSLRPIITLLAILSVIWDSGVFTQIWVMTQGGPNKGTYTLGIWSYATAFSGQEFGLGASIAVVSVFLVGAVTIYYIRRMFRAGEIA